MKSWLLAVLLPLIVIVAGAFYQSSAQRVSPNSPPPSIYGFLEIADSGADEIEIARANLLCAKGLPGADDLDIKAALARLDRWAAQVRAETDRHLYKYLADPADYENSEAYFRVLMLITVLQQDFGVRYNPDRINEPDFTNSKDLFIHGMVGSQNGGTCVSMPVLYVAVGRRLGYPLKLVVTKGHVFARWDDDRERFNIEGTNRGLNVHPDDHYKTFPYKLTQAEVDGGWLLRSLTPAEELAVFLIQRGHCLEDTGRLSEARTAYAAAGRLAPKSEAGAFLSMLDRREAGIVRNLDPLVEVRSQPHRQEYIERIMEKQEQRMHDLGPKLPTPGTSRRPTNPARPPNPGVPDGRN